MNVQNKNENWYLRVKPVKIIKRYVFTEETAEKKLFSNYFRICRQRWKLMRI